MRQVGILAAAGLYALNHNRTRMSVDHQNAKKVAKGKKFLWKNLRCLNRSEKDKLKQGDNCTRKTQVQTY